MPWRSFSYNGSVSYRGGGSKFQIWWRVDFWCRRSGAATIIQLSLPPHWRWRHLYLLQLEHCIQELCHMAEWTQRLKDRLVPSLRWEFATTTVMPATNMPHNLIETSQSAFVPGNTLGRFMVNDWGRDGRCRLFVSLCFLLGALLFRQFAYPTHEMIGSIF